MTSIAPYGAPGEILRILAGTRWDAPTVHRGRICKCTSSLFTLTYNFKKAPHGKIRRGLRCYRNQALLVYSVCSSS